MRYRDVILVWAIVTLRFVQIKTQDESETKKLDKDGLNEPKEGQTVMRKLVETVMRKLDEGDLNKPEETVVHKIVDGELDKPEETVMRKLDEGEPKILEELIGPDEIEKAKPAYRQLNILRGLADVSRNAFTGINLNAKSAITAGIANAITQTTGTIGANVISVLPGLAPVVVDVTGTINGTVDLGRMGTQNIWDTEGFLFNRTADLVP
ncbi:unnamed protein product [Nezara viridula]|uniref:Neuropeptide n=1 Tax=Nezara viridula TaxID=85310 RepID=A0A9P0HRK3_NEZVI|nr:unnamed protein product [Nezara viridula]